MLKSKISYRWNLHSGVLALAVLGLTLPVAAQTAPGAFFYKDGDRIQILGDSITQQRMYSTLMESYVLSRFPTWSLTVRNTGWGGDTMGLRQRGNLEKGFARDLAPLNSTAVTIDFGMNDARAGEGGIPSYVANARILADKFKAAGARVAFVTSSPEEKYEAGQPAGSAYNVILRKYSEALKPVADEKGVLFIDQLNPVIKNTEDARAAGVVTATPSQTRFIPDSVHPQWAGHLLMASAILQGLNAPSLVSRVEIDAPSGKAQTEAAQVTQVTPGEGLTFTRLDNALPWPLPAETALALKVPGFTPLQDLSRFELKVSGLTAANYELSIDGKAVGTFTKDALATGINLSAVNSGPIYQQTQALLGKINDKNGMFYERWRNVQIYESPAWIKSNIDADKAAELKRLDDQIAATEAQINTLRLPKPHVWSLKAAL